MEFLKFNKKYIIDSYITSKKKALNAFKKTQYEKSLNFIKISAQIANNFNWVYIDDDLEKRLNNISKALLKPCIDYKPLDDNRIVFFDSFSWDNKGLTQQYLRAFMSIGIKFLYLTESSKTNINSKYIFEELKKYDKADIVEIPQNIKRTEQIKLIYDNILSYKANKLFMHLSPSAVSAITAFYSLPKEIAKYQINLTDHAFWLGSNCLDYTLEFRPRGCTISKEKRGLKENQVLLQSMYPIINESAFEGFPEEYTKGKVVIFSGGAFYKVSGDSGEFFNLVKRILDDNHNAVFLFAGIGDSFLIERFIKKNRFENRFILIGNRSDINEVFKHCDIYMGTYPEGGGLMSQYAAMNGKPILNYMTESGGIEVEEIVCQNKNCNITFTDKEKFLEEAKKLINDLNYRKKRGEEINFGLTTKEQFNKNLLQNILSNKNQRQYQDVKINYEKIFDQNIENQNTLQSYKSFIIKNYKIHTVILFPKIFIWFVLFSFSKRGLDKILNRLRVKISNNPLKPINN